MTLTLRRAGVDDADVLRENAAAGFATYRDFAPGWSPPAHEDERALLVERLADPATWSAVAERDGRVAGHALTVPAASAHRRDPDPALLHVGALFVRPEFWGTGVAAALLDAAVADGRDRGFGQMRLFTPVAHARARRFYEREGWSTASGPAFDPRLELVLVEYRRPLA